MERVRPVVGTFWSPRRPCPQSVRIGGVKIDYGITHHAAEQFLARLTEAVLGNPPCLCGIPGCDRANELPVVMPRGHCATFGSAHSHKPLHLLLQLRNNLGHAGYACNGGDCHMEFGVLVKVWVQLVAGLEFLVQPFEEFDLGRRGPQRCQFAGLRLKELANEKNLLNIRQRNAVHERSPLRQYPDEAFGGQPVQGLTHRRFTGSERTGYRRFVNDGVRCQVAGQDAALNLTVRRFYQGSTCGLGHMPNATGIRLKF